MKLTFTPRLREVDSGVGAGIHIEVVIESFGTQIGVQG